MYTNYLVSTPFAIMIPGQLAVTQFEQVASQVGTSFCHTLMNPALTPSLAFFLMQPIMEGFAACLYASPSPFTELEFIGAIANSRPSDILPTNFSLNPKLNTQPLLKLVINLQPVDENLQALCSYLPEKQNQYAMAIAANLEQFLQSYPKELIQNQDQTMLVVPTIALDKWIKRFQEKYQMDPNFLYK